MWIIKYFIINLVNGKWNKQNFARKRKRKDMEISIKSSTASVKKLVKKIVLIVTKIKVVMLVIIFLAQVQRKWNYKKSYRTISNVNYFLLVNFSVLQVIFEEVSRCPDCDERLTLSDNLNNRIEMANSFEMNCNVSSYKNNFYC